MSDKTLKLTKLFLFLVALHSFLVGILLIFLPVNIIEIFGFQPYTQNFFRAQGGVFHIVMSFAYFMAGLNPLKYVSLLQFSFTAKFTGFVFLILYYLIVNQITLILLSGVADLLMGIVIFLLYQKLKQVNI